MKTLIVATDYSVAAMDATRYAAALAKHMKAKLILYHAFYFQETSSKVWIDIPTLQELRIEHEVKLNSIKRDINRIYQVSVKCVASEEPIQEGLPKLVAKYHADIVVMGMRHVSVFDRKVFGSTATKLINQAGFPILLIPETVHFTEYKHILFPYAFLSISVDHTLHLLKKLAFTFTSELLLLHVEQPETALAEHTGNSTKKYAHLENILHQIKHEYKFTEEDDIAAGINKAIRQYQADLLVMVPQKHGFWDQLMHKSITKQMAFQTHIPLLTLPNP